MTQDLARTGLNELITFYDDATGYQFSLALGAESSPQPGYDDFVASVSRRFG